jgi:hypothetical protein
MGASKLTTEVTYSLEGGKAEVMELLLPSSERRKPVVSSEDAYRFSLRWQGDELDVAKAKFTNTPMICKCLDHKCDRLCGLVVGVPGYKTRCIVFPVRYELNLYMLCRRKYTASVVLVVRLPGTDPEVRI